MLTLYYASATFLQSWRIQKVCCKITEQIGMHASVSFYTAAIADGYDASLATSDRCVNRSSAKVSQLLWLNGNQRGCCLVPLQTLHIAPWISFPDAAAVPSGNEAICNWVPFAYSGDGASGLPSHQQCVVKLLLEMETQPRPDFERYADVVKIEEFGKLIAWKIDSHLAVVIETDVEHFTKLLIATYLQNNFLINDHLPLIRIESVNYESTPQPFELVSNHMRKATRTAALLTDDEWQKHLDTLRALCVFAHQANEFEYKKNRTEGKTGLIEKPDLITSATPQANLPNSTSTDMPTATAGDQTVTTLLTLASREPSFHSSDSELVKPESVQPATIRLPSANSETSETELVVPAMSEIEHTQATVIAATTAGRVSPAKINLASSKLVDSIDTPKAPAPMLVPQTVDAQAQPASLAAQSVGDIGNGVMLSASKDNTKRPSLRRNKDSLRDSKPLNILIYSDSTSAREGVMSTLKDILESDTYTIYAMTPPQVQQKYWLENTALLVVCGPVAPELGEVLVDYFLCGGKVLSLCSDILNFVLPTYRTAEVREHELVQFSYDKWQKVKMMHHIFCYQPSPVKKHFSTDSDDSTVQANARKSVMLCPRSIELKDLNGIAHNLDVRVLGTEETWNTPSIMLANCIKTGGKAVFSQIHLEISPNAYEMDESKFSILKQNEQVRLEIFADLLRKYLDVNVKQNTKFDNSPSKRRVYQNAYFLGTYESKAALLQKLNAQIGGTGNIISTSKLTIKFCDRDEIPPQANTNVLPILIHSCPDDFSTVEYFEHLNTKEIGRLVVYAPVVSSSMNVIDELDLTHGIAVLARQQTDGVGRSNNQWLSPLGCAMFSFQLHISLDSTLGSRLPLLQHIVGAALVNALRVKYKNLDFALKWPNDIYANGFTKIGGLIIQTILIGKVAIVNIGCGLNLDNTKPTLCINDIIKDYNRVNNQDLPFLKYEELVALSFNEIERLVNQIQNSGAFEEFYKIYYHLWLHNNQSVSIFDGDGKEKNAQVVGIDDYGYLKVKLSTGVVVAVQPDGNTFDMLKGLIIPKFH